MGSVFTALSTAALFAGCVDGPDAKSAAPTSDEVTISKPGGAQVTISSTSSSLTAAARSTAAAFVATRPAILQTSPLDAFVQQRAEVSEGMTYVPYERTYAGLRVVGGDFVTVIDRAGQIAHHSVALQHPIDLASVTPKLSQSGAQTIATQRLRSVTSVEGTELVVYALDATPRLAWESTVNGIGANGISRLTVHVDAITGAVLHEQEHVMYGSGTSAWNGPNPVPLATTQSGSTFSLKDPTITNLSCQDAANNTTFSGPDDLWGNGNATSRETGCVDALFGTQTEAKMLTQWLGRNAQDGAGGAWPIRVGLADVNAFYDGTQIQVGHNNANQWIGAIDVIAHENGHGIDDHTPGGISGNGTQEFIADTFGAATEWFANEPSPFDVPDFTVGEQINLVGQGPIRVMYNPSIVGDANCYSSSIPTTEVHAAAGPGNHWFYLLAQGTNPTNGQPVSPTCNSTTIVGLGTQNAIKILYNAMLLKTTGASYLKYRTWTLQASINLFPGSCTQFNTVKAAWDAVSVPAQAADPTCSGGGGGDTTPPTASITSPTSGATVSGTITVAANAADNVGVSRVDVLVDGTVVGSDTTSPYTVAVNTTTLSNGSHAITARAVDAANNTGTSATVTVTVSNAGGGGTNLLLNPGFESGTANWTATAGVLGNAGTAHTGTGFAWLNGYGTAHTDSLFQQVTIPGSSTSAQLCYWLSISTAETTTTTQFDKLQVQLRNSAGTVLTTLATFSNLNAGGYHQVCNSVGSFAGQTVRAYFLGTEDSSLQTSFFLDDLTLQ